ncbi:ROK family protein [Candidatus Woesearchaeota archaeon]|nr:ROK family protein [Candidatus Woesearchaeota archaeon]
MKLAIGIDLGGTKIQGILMDEKGKVLNTYRRPTEADTSRNKIIENIIEVINKLNTEGVLGVGIGTPGFVRPNGRMSSVPNLIKLRDFNLKKALIKRTKIKICMENDANCFALAEHTKGAAKGCTNSIGVIIGTGVGTGIIINNKIYSGSGGGAGEAGHAKLVVDNAVKDVEDLISGPNIIKMYEELSGKKALSPKVILNKRDKAARHVYNEVVFYTGLFFANLINTFNPECIVVGGGVSNLPFYPHVRKSVKKYANPFMAKMCKIKKHAIGDDAGAIGAAQLVFSD